MIWKKKKKTKESAPAAPEQAAPVEAVDIAATDSGELVEDKGDVVTEPTEEQAAEPVAQAKPVERPIPELDWERVLDVEIDSITKFSEDYWIVHLKSGENISLDTKGTFFVYTPAPKWNHKTERTEIGDIIIFERGAVPEMVSRGLTNVIYDERIARGLIDPPEPPETPTYNAWTVQYDPAQDPKNKKPAKDNAGNSGGPPSKKPTGP